MHALELNVRESNKLTKKELKSCGFPTHSFAHVSTSPQLHICHLSVTPFIAPAPHFSSHGVREEAAPAAGDTDLFHAEYAERDQLDPDDPRVRHRRGKGHRG